MTEFSPNNGSTLYESSHKKNESEFEEISSRIIEDDEPAYNNSIDINVFESKVDRYKMGNFQNQLNELETETISVSEYFENSKMIGKEQLKESEEPKFVFIKNDMTPEIVIPQEAQKIGGNTKEESLKNNITQQNEQIFNCLESLTWSLRKIYYRNFFNRLITFYIQSLKEEQRKIRQTKEIEIKQLKEQNWPFKELYYKKYRTPNEEIMFEFINLCASKIQATFKAYIMHKRHKIAIRKVNRFKEKLCAVLRGWKASNIYNSKKIQEIRKSFAETTLMIEQEIENPNIDRIKKMKKIEYLQLSQETFKENFQKCYKYLYESGAWIFEVEKCFKKRNFPTKNHKMTKNQSLEGFSSSLTKMNNYDNENIILSQQEKSENPEQPIRRGRQREFRVGNKNLSKDREEFFKTPENNDLTTNYSALSLSQQASEDRPIIAKGKYEFTEEDLKNNENEFLKMSDINKNKKEIDEKIENKISMTSEEKALEEQPKINKFRDEEKKKLVKRQKYDPRKAIEEEKKRQEEEKKLKMEREKEKQKESFEEVNLQEVSEDSKEEKIKKVVTKKNESESISSKRTPRIQIKNQKQSHQQQRQNTIVESPKESSKEKTVEKVKKENKLTKKGDNNKSIKSIVNHKKVESKVDCWGPKKDNNIVAGNTGERYSNNNNVDDNASYKSKYLLSLIKEKNYTSYEKQIIHKYSKKEQYEEEGLENYEREEQEEWTPIVDQFQREKQKEIKRYSYLNNRQSEVEYDENERNFEEQESSHEEEAYQSSYLRKLVDSKETGKFSYANGKVSSAGKTKLSDKISVKKEEERLQQRFENLSNHIKNRISSSSDGVHNNNFTNPYSVISSNKKPVEPSNNIKKNSNNESHRPIESLEEVYTSQYTDRLNNLKTKLNMLESARYIQRDESVPVLLEDTKYVKKMYKDGTFSTLYWPQVRTMETAFLDYVKLTGF